MKKLFTLIACAMMAFTANAQLISFTEAASAGTLNDKEFSSDGLVLKVTDTGSKIAVDANSCLFGTAESDTVRFAYRMKTGGKSSSSNQLTLTVPTDGTLKIYARTGSNSATNRNIVVTNSGDTVLIDKILLEQDTTNVGKKAYLPLSAEVTAGTYTITYPVGSINIYGFELVQPASPVDVASLAGTYAAQQTGTSYIRGDYSKWQSYSDSYDSKVTVDGTALTLQAHVGGEYLYTIAGTVDATAQTITFQPQTLSWMTIADTTSATTPIVAKFADVNGNVTITFPYWATWSSSNGYVYETNRTLVLTKKPETKLEWSTDANITWAHAGAADIYAGKATISKYDDGTYKISNYAGGNCTPETIDINASDPTALKVINRGNSDGGYFYYISSTATDDAWIEGDEMTLTGGTQEKGTFSGKYYYFIYDTDWTQQFVDTVTISWPYVAPTFAKGDVNEDGVVDVKDVNAVIEIICGKK